VLEKTAAQLRTQGVDVADFQLPSEFAELPTIHSTILNRGLSESLKGDYDRAKAQMSERLQMMIEDGLRIENGTYEKQRSFAEKCRASINSVLTNVDALLCPSTPGEAPAGMATGNPIFQVVWTLLGVPRLNIPVGFGPNGLPVSVQLVGKRHRDADLLGLGRHLAQRLSCVNMVSAVHPWA
jgi:Asp-tRNA(Asn)/Glu-tRNA(Gln) amidotransferase A subunit family amidase